MNKLILKYILKFIQLVIKIYALLYHQHIYISIYLLSSTALSFACCASIPLASSSPTTNAPGKPEG
jgi:hypothetical protein